MDSLSPTEVDGLLTEYFKNHRSITCRQFQQTYGMTRTTAYRRLAILMQGEHPSLMREGTKILLSINQLRDITAGHILTNAGNEADKVKGESGKVEESLTEFNLKCWGVN